MLDFLLWEYHVEKGDLVNRTDRLLAMVLELQGRDRVTAEELARTFEVTKRTIYRDIGALNASGVPVVSAAGQGYWLMEGYFLPPVSLSPDEAIMLVLGGEVMAQSFDAQYQEAAKSASRKIEALLSRDVQKEVVYLKENIRFINPDSKVLSDVPGALQGVRRAILEQKSLHLHYFKRAGGYRGELTERTVDPHGLVHFRGAWLLSAYCHMRKAMRMFRLERIRQITVLPKTFTRQADFSVYKLHEPQAQTVTVDLLFDGEVAQWVRERPAFYSGTYEDTSEGLRVTLSVEHPDKLLSWLLSWGAKVRVLGPESLKKRVREELGATLEGYSSTY